MQWRPEWMSVFRGRTTRAAAHFHRGRELQRLKRLEEAFDSYGRAIALRPDFAEAFNNRGNALQGLGRFVEAVASYDKAIALKPDRAHQFQNRGNALARLRRFNDALASYDEAIALDPRNLDAILSRVSALFDCRRFDDALADCETAIALDPTGDRPMRALITCLLNTCDWSGLQRHRKNISAAIAAGSCMIPPLLHSAISDSEEERLLNARNWARAERPPDAKPLWHGERYRHDRLRIAYLSGDFGEHAVSSLIGGVFGRHDKTRFETIALSGASDDKGERRASMVADFDRFIDIGAMNDAKAAALMREMEIDIAVDLSGYTFARRTSVLAYRPAPVQVNYLGYPGTMGADFLDYIIADRFVIPQTNQAYHTENVVYLPDSYQANTERQVADLTGTRVAAGLPEFGFVFCCFNNIYKIRPEIFELWMRLLHQVDESVLWLLEANPDAMSTLRREAKARGVSPDRLIFAPRRPRPEHLARQRHVDLFLDTLPYNAHTTGSDALWMNLPVLTCLGNTFPGRVAASLLNAIGMPELVADSLTAYESRALTFARDPTLLAAVKAKLAAHRDKFPLFDTGRFTRNLEAAFAEMWRRHQRGQPPESFSIPDLSRP